MSGSPFNLSFQNKNVNNKIVIALERISQVFRVLLWNESNTHGLSPIQIQILIFLNHHSEEKRKVGYLSEEFNLSKATISETIKILHNKELIRKEYSSGDHRSFFIQLTKKGQQLAIQTSLFTQVLHTPIDRLNNEDKENLLLSLMGIIQHLQTKDVITIQRMCFSCSSYSKHHKNHPHYCKFLNTPLKTSELRLDCPEHTSLNDSH